MKNVLVVDDFYKNPDAIRKLALEAEYAPRGSSNPNFAGLETKHAFHSQSLIDRFESVVRSPIVVDLSTNTFGRFRMAKADDTRRTHIHFDNTDWTCLIYLSKDISEGQGGTIFVKHKETGFFGPMSDEELKSRGYKSRSDFDLRVVAPHTLQREAWQVHIRVANKYNRAVFFRGSQLFHGSDGLFGTDRETARLTQNFFFNERKEAIC